MLLARSLSARRATARGKVKQPLFLWRAGGCISLLVTAITIQQFAMTHPPAWRHQHRPLDVIALICLACGVILLLDGVRYTRRLPRTLKTRAVG